MNGSTDFESELHDRLAALAEPAPAMAEGVVTEIRRGAIRRRRRAQAVAVAAALLAVLGTGAVVRSALPGAGPPPGTSAVPAHELLGWPSRTSSGDAEFDTRAIGRAWRAGGTVVHLLYAGTLPSRTQVALVERRTETGEARLAVLTRDTGDWRVRLDAAGFDTVPEYLFITVDARGAPSTMIVLGAPHAREARVNNTGGQPMAFLRSGSVAQFAVPKETAERLRLYVLPPGPAYEEWALRRWAAQGEPDDQLRMLVPGIRLR